MRLCPEGNSLCRLEHRCNPMASIQLLDPSPHAQFEISQILAGELENHCQCCPLQDRGYYLTPVQHTLSLYGRTLTEDRGYIDNGYKQNISPVLLHPAYLLPPYRCAFDIIKEKKKESSLGNEFTITPPASPKL